MKKEVSPGLIIGIIGALVVGIAAYFIFSGRGSAEPIDIKKLDPKALRDENPVRRGQPGYRERTTDPTSG